MVTLPASTDCDADGAFCAGDDRPIATEPTATVPEPTQKATPPPPAFTASIVALAIHDVSRATDLTVSFSKNPPDYSWRTIKTSTFKV